MLSDEHVALRVCIFWEKWFALACVGEGLTSAPSIFAWAMMPVTLTSGASYLHIFLVSCIVTAIRLLFVFPNLQRVPPYGVSSSGVPWFCHMWTVVLVFWYSASLMTLPDASATPARTMLITILSWLSFANASLVLMSCAWLWFTHKTQLSRASSLPMTAVMDEASDSRVSKTTPRDQTLQTFQLCDEDLRGRCSAVCAVCLEELSIGDLVTELTCHHTFHAQCINAWLLRSHGGRCPMRCQEPQAASGAQGHTLGTSPAEVLSEPQANIASEDSAEVTAEIPTSV